jgi:hypothetical protein
LNLNFRFQNLWLERENGGLSIRRFKKLCVKAGVPYNLRPSFASHHLAQLIKEASMFHPVFSLVSISAIALGNIANAIAQPSTPKVQSNEVLQMVMVDQTQLSSSQRNAFQQYIQTASLPVTKVGKRCQYYGKPDVWCLILDAPVANQVFQQISRQPFGSAASVKAVRRLRAPEKN